MIEIDDKKLWGNEAADDENPEVLRSYFVFHKNYNEFFDDDEKLVIARAQKGMGKSALINRYADKLESEGEPIVINIKGADLVAQKVEGNLNSSEYIYDWQQRICMAINRELGSRIGFAANDDEILLVENSELLGFKRKNLLGSLISRLKNKIGPIELEKIGITDQEQLLRRVANDSRAGRIYLLIDDIDATFHSTDKECLRLSTFFSACRDIVRNFQDIYIRVVIRSDVWATIRKSDEALDKVEQYIFDLKWSIKEMGALLGGRVLSYEGRKNNSDISLDCLSQETWKKALGKVMENPFPWGSGKANNYRIIHTYSAGRPRWALQLCKMAADEAMKVNQHSSTQQRIKFGHIKQVLEEYGQFRLDDATREHIHQCENISLIVNTFSSQRYRYNTSQLLRFIKDSILNNMDVLVDSENIDEPHQLARFLFKIGFIIGAKHDGNGFDYSTFEDKPDLLQNYSNMDDGLDWVIHPSFQAALGVSK